MYTNYLSLHWDAIEDDEIENFEIEYSVKLHPSHRALLLEINGGFCESNDSLNGRILFFPVSDSASSLGSMIYEQRNEENIPIAQTMNADLIYMNTLDGKILFKKKIIADSLVSFFKSNVLPLNHKGIDPL